jgi:hypothetical protein
MIESTSQAFLDILDPAKDRLYGLAHAAERDHAELRLQRSAREVFQQFHNRDIGPTDVLARIESQLQAGQTQAPTPATESTPMPAAVWARLVAAVQIDAARLGGVAEQSMLAYDPLLAPQKSKPKDDGTEGLNLSPWSRFVIAAAIVLTVGIAASLILTTHQSSPKSGAPPVITPHNKKPPSGPSGAKPATSAPATKPLTPPLKKTVAPT